MSDINDTSQIISCIEKLENAKLNINIPNSDYPWKYSNIKLYQTTLTEEERIIILDVLRALTNH